MKISMCRRRSANLLEILTLLALSSTIHSLPAKAKVIGPARVGTATYTIDFSGYKGGAVDKWLETQNYKLERDARNRNLLALSISDGILTLEEKGRMSGFILNHSVNLDKVQKVRINWGITKYPLEASYQNKVNNEALMIYILFGKEKISSGHILIPNSPYFIGLFLCQDEQVNYPYKGRYFHEGGRFVCLGKPEPGHITLSEFDLDRGFKSYFAKTKTPGITAIAFGADTSKAGGDGTGGAFIKSIEFVEEPPVAAFRIH
jgi:hypothetical protein